MSTGNLRTIGSQHSRLSAASVASIHEFGLLKQFLDTQSSRRLGMSDPAANRPRIDATCD